MPRHSGGKKTKSSSVTVRVSDRVKYGIDLIGRLYGESHSEVVARALKHLFEAEHRSLLVQIGAQRVDLLREAYSEDEWERFLKLAMLYPAALSEDEKNIWARIQDNKSYWQKRGGERVLNWDKVMADAEILTRS